MINSKLKNISQYIDNIKKEAYLDIENIENLALSKDLNSDLFKNYMADFKPAKLKMTFIVGQIFLFYLKAFLRFFTYIIGYILFVFIGKKGTVDWSQKFILVDVFFLVDNIIKEKQIKENYFDGLYDVLDKCNKKYIFFPRLYGVSKNPFKLIKLFNITNKLNDRVVLYEYELLNFLDMLKILFFIFRFPFKQFKLLQKNKIELDHHFNYELFRVLPNTPIIAYTRYLTGKALAKKIANNSKIISWQELQSSEKSFNRAIRESKKEIVIYGCEFSMTYSSYISMHITDVDCDMRITPHQTLLNGRSNYSDSKKHIFRSGVSLRYKGLFKYVDHNQEGRMPLALMGHDIKEGQDILKKIQFLPALNVKIHPTTTESQFSKYMNQNWSYVCGDLYTVFKNASVIFAPPYAGTSLEAVACGIPVVIIGKIDNLINPLVDFGKGEIWNIAFSDKEAIIQYEKLLKYKKDNPKRVKDIAFWYKNFFFIEPTKDKIVKAFELE